MSESNTLPFFSIGIPAFKIKFLEECITSILLQDFNNFELIIINDCSPDPLETIVTKFDDKRIRYYVNEFNIGGEDVVNNWNKCLSYARGKFFVLMGDDDKLEYNYLSSFAGLIDKYQDLDIFHCRTRIIDEKNVFVGLTSSWPEYETLLDNIWHRMQGGRLQFISDFVYRTDKLKENGGFYYLPLAWGSDDLSAFIAADLKGIAHTNKIIFNYRTNPLNITSSGNDDLKMSAVLQMENWFRLLILKKSDITLEVELLGLIKNEVRKYILKKKVAIIANSILKKGIFKSIYWYKKRKSYNYSFKDLLFSIFESYKIAIAKKTF